MVVDVPSLSCETLMEVCIKPALLCQSFCDHNKNFAKKPMFTSLPINHTGLGSGHKVTARMGRKK